MRTIRLFLVSAVLLIAGITALFSNFKGSANFTGAFPLSAASISIQGSAVGAWTAIGMIGTCAGVVMFAVALISAILMEFSGSSPRLKS